MYDKYLIYHKKIIVSRLFYAVCTALPLCCVLKCEQGAGITRRPVRIAYMYPLEASMCAVSRRCCIPAQYVRAAPEDFLSGAIFQVFRLP